MASLKHSTHSVTIEAPFNIAWDYISNPLNQPNWAVNFVKGARLEGEKLIMTTVMGEDTVDWQANREQGIIDSIGSDGTVTPTRLIEIGDSLLYIFTFSMPVEVPGQVFAEGQAGMDEELAMLKKIVEALVVESA